MIELLGRQRVWLYVLSIAFGILFWLVHPMMGVAVSLGVIASYEFYLTLYVEDDG